MDILLIIGSIGGLLTIIIGMMVKGADVAVLLNPAAAIIIIFGTIMAVNNSFPGKEFFNIGKISGVLFSNKKKQDPTEIIREIVQLAQTARKEGLLSLEAVIDKSENKFMKKGLSMVVDGIEQQFVRDLLNLEIECMEDRHRAGASIWTAGGGAAPTLGVLGAVIGLIGALGNLNDIEKLGHMIAGAFVATLYGIFLGYVICHPYASRLKRKSHEEAHMLRIMMEGILSVQAGENPKSIEMKLLTMLDPKEREEYEKHNPDKAGKGE
jgi:chemotaxis protein MotA